MGNEGLTGANLYENVLDILFHISDASDLITHFDIF